MEAQQQEPEANYYQNQGNEYDSLRYRLGSEEHILDIIDDLTGAIRDKYGNIAGYDEEKRQINNIGAKAILMWLKSHLSKNTSISNFENIHHCHTYTRTVMRDLTEMIVLNRKKWQIKNKSTILRNVEDPTYLNNLRAVGAKELEAISTIHHVSENIGATPNPGGYMEQQPRRGITGWFRR